MCFLNCLLTLSIANLFFALFIVLTCYFVVGTVVAMGISLLLTGIVFIGIKVWVDNL